jgi:hypothetical protein
MAKNVQSALGHMSISRIPYYINFAAFNIIQGTAWTVFFTTMNFKTPAIMVDNYEFTMLVMEIEIN